MSPSQAGIIMLSPSMAGIRSSCSTAPRRDWRRTSGAGEQQSRTRRRSCLGGGGGGGQTSRPPSCWRSRLSVIWLSGRVLTVKGLWRPSYQHWSQVWGRRNVAWKNRYGIRIVLICGHRDFFFLFFFKDFKTTNYYTTLHLFSFIFGFILFV